MLLCAPFLIFLLGTVGGLFRNIEIAQFCAYVSCPMVTNALHLSFYTTIISTFLAVLLGTPIAYLLAHGRFRGKDLLDTMVDFPLVLPPSAAGIALLLTFGNNGIGPLIHFRPIGTAAAVILAQLFVASPFYIKQARGGFESVSTNLKLASTTLGASAWRTFFKVTVPISKRSLIAGTTMTWARALGEFGATITFAGAFEGKTETMPIAIYNALTSNTPASIALAAALVVISFIVLEAGELLVKAL
jgi:molybdate transport system permease protein